MRKIIKFLAEKPLIFNTVRFILEANHISLKKTIRKEFLLRNKKTNYSTGKILDVPCGTGGFCMLFHPDSYLGLDISKTYIDYAQKKYKRRFIHRNILKNGFDNDYFDKILMLGFLHHLDDSTVDSVLKETKRILKPDGTLLLIEDSPITARWNIIGKVILKNDIGSNIRTGTEYKTILEKYFIIKNFYKVKSGLFNYSVFVLLPVK